MMISKSAAVKLSNLTKRLENNLNKQEESESENFRIYLEFCAVIFENKGSIREVFNLIKTTKDSHALEQVNKIYPDKKDPGREKYLKGKRQQVSDKMTCAGNKILQFLIDINDNRITDNADYRVLQLSLTEEQQQSLSTWIAELPKNEVFQNVIKPERIEEEQLFLTVTHSRNSFLSISDRVVETIQTLKKTHKENNVVVDLTVEDIEKYWQENHSDMKSLSNKQKYRVLECYQKFSESLPIVQSIVPTQTVKIRCSERLVKSNKQVKPLFKPLFIKTTNLVKRKRAVSNRQANNCRKRISHGSSSQKNSQKADIEDLDADDEKVIEDSDAADGVVIEDSDAEDGDAADGAVIEDSDAEDGDAADGAEIEGSDATQQKNPQSADIELGSMEEEQKQEETSIDNQLVEAVELFSKQLILWDLSEQELVVLGRRLVKCLGDKSKSTNIKAILHIDGLQSFVKPIESTGELKIAMPASALLNNVCINREDTVKNTVTASADHVDEIFRLDKAVDRIVPVEIIDYAEVTTVNHILLSEADRSSSDRQLEACVLSLYLHAIRVHAITRQCFLDKPIYNQLRLEDYLKHKEFLLLFESTNFSFNLP